MPLENVTITASGNSTPPANTCIAGFKTSASFFIQAFLVSDTNGNQFGIGAASPIFVTQNNMSGSAAGSPTFVSVTNLSGSVAGSPLFASITNSPSVFVTSAIASPIFFRISDGTDTAVVDAASRLLVTASLTDGLTVTSASVTIVNNSTASVLFTSACITNLAGSAAGSPLFVSACLTNLAGSAAGSPLFVSACITNAAGSAAGSPIFSSITNLAGSAAGSPLFTSTCITNLAGSAAGSPLFTSITNLAGSAAGSPLFVSACITNSAGSAAGSPIFTSITNLSGSASGSPLFVSACITNLAGSAAGSPLFTSTCITNLAGSAAGSPLFARITDGTDTAIVDSTCRLAIALTDGTNAYGLPASPLSQAGQGQTMWWAGSLLTIQQINISSSVSGCTRMVASTSGAAIVILNATFTTSSCQFIGWIASGAGTASAAVQTAMPFGTFGGMDAKRSPDSYLWSFPSGSNAIMTTTSACVVAGTINYINVAS